MYQQSMFSSKNKKNITFFHLKIIFFYNREKLQYITWACFHYDNQKSVSEDLETWHKVWMTSS